MATKKVRLVLYRKSGRFLWFNIKEECRECNISYVILQQFLSEQMKNMPVTLNILPWLNNWWRLFWRGGVHPPILTVNGRIFSQRVVPDLQELSHNITSILGNREIIHDEIPKAAKTPPPADVRGISLYYSPACPHCRRLLSYLGAHGIGYTGHDVTKTETARKRVKELTGSMTIPVTVIDSEVIVGFNKELLRRKLAIEKERTTTEVDREVVGRVVHDDRLHVIAEKAASILKGNWVDGWTVPSRKLYPHLWNWDSGFTARGYLYINPDRAYEELRSLFRAQWVNGFLPHIVFNAGYIHHFPGPDYWRAHRSGMVPQGLFTSGISQPPVHATMMAHAVDIDPNKDRARAFLREIYPKLNSLHQFFFEYRDPDNEGLVYIVHPWESGLDNSPLWDEPLSSIAASSRWASKMQKHYDALAVKGKRPKRAYIEKYSYLVQNLYRKKYDWLSINRAHPFKVQDVLFNTILCQAERDLALVAHEIGEDPQPHIHRSDRMREACNKKLWVEDKGLYCDFDLLKGRLINRDTIFSYMPLFAGIPNQREGLTLLDTLRSHCFCVADGDCVAIPSYDMCQADFEGELYWRGPVWVNVNWYLAQGVRGYGDNELATWIENSLLSLVDTHGFYEYYDPNTGKGLGAAEFSWTAALILDIIGRRMRIRKGEAG